MYPKKSNGGTTQRVKRSPDDKRGTEETDLNGSASAPLRPVRAQKRGTPRSSDRPSSPPLPQPEPTIFVPQFWPLFFRVPSAKRHPPEEKSRASKHRRAYREPAVISPHFPHQLRPENPSHLFLWSPPPCRRKGCLAHRQRSDSQGPFREPVPAAAAAAAAHVPKWRSERELLRADRWFHALNVALGERCCTRAVRSRAPTSKPREPAHKMMNERKHTTRDGTKAVRT